jgi:hypothetical protein
MLGLLLSPLEEFLRLGTHASGVLALTPVGSGTARQRRAYQPVATAPGADSGILPE